MKKPNFFIIGAPKCGTTSVAAWLATHPQVFMSPVKEPHHFNTDSKPLTPNRRDYESLFELASANHKAVGEASVWYLESATAVAAIEEYAPSPRYVVCLRNPVEAAPSLHEQQIHNGNEHLIDFRAAWNASDARLRGNDVSWRCKDVPRHLAYKQMCCLGRQMSRLLAGIPPRRLHAILLDDLRQNPTHEYSRLLSFLGVDDDRRNEFPTLNPAKARRSRILHDTTLFFGIVRGCLFPRRFPGLGCLNRINRWNTRYRARPPLTDSMVSELKDYFREDVRLLSGLLNRDLSHWCN